MDSILTFPAGAPTTNGRLLTVDRALRNPTIIQKAIVARGMNFLSDTLFGKGTTETGAVIFSKTRLGENYPERGDSEIVEPGSEYPMVDVGDDADQVELAKKFGAGFKVHDEARDRNDTAVIARGNLKLKNAIIRQDAHRSVAAFRKDVAVTEVDAWTGALAARTAIVRAKAAIEATELGYVPDTIMVHPETYADVELMQELLTYAPRESKTDNPLYGASLDGLFGLHWVKSNLVPNNEAIITTQKVVGTNYIEKPFAVKAVREETIDTTIVIGSMRSVPVVTDPMAAVVLKGIR